MNKSKQIIGVDFQGWPIYKMSYRDILDAIGFTEVDGKYQISADASVLDTCPMILDDDGMGYGVNQRYITCVSSEQILFADNEQMPSKEASEWLLYLKGIKNDRLAEDMYEVALIASLQSDDSLDQIKEKVKKSLSNDYILQKYGFENIADINWELYKID